MSSFSLCQVRDTQPLLCVVGYVKEEEEVVPLASVLSLCPSWLWVDELARALSSLDFDGERPSTSSAYICRISRCRAVSDLALRSAGRKTLVNGTHLGIWTENVTKRSPSLPLYTDLMPRFFRTISSPGCVPPGTRTSTSPSRVGTRTRPPRIAVWNGMRTSWYRLVPCRRNIFELATPTRTSKSPG